MGWVICLAVNSKRPKDISMVVTCKDKIIDSQTLLQKTIIHVQAAINNE